MRRLIVGVFLILLLPGSAAASEIVAKARTGQWKISVITDGDSWKDDCSLNLIAETYQLKRETTLKRAHVNCALFGPVHVIAAESNDGKSTLAFFEAARGGDGDHSGPIIEIYRLTNHGFQKLGEQQLFHATYHRKDKEITAVTGAVLYSLCYTCDGPDASDPEDNFYISTKIMISSTGISIKPTISKQERKVLLDKFDSRVAQAIKDHDFDKNYPAFVKNLRQQLEMFLKK
jgi:hypothetical protein